MSKEDRSPCKVGEAALSRDCTTVRSREVGLSGMSACSRRATATGWICPVGQCLWGNCTGFGSRGLGIHCTAHEMAHPVGCSSVHRHRFCSGGFCILHFQKHSTGQLCAFGWALLPFLRCLLPVRKNSPSCSTWGHKREAEQQLVSLLLPLYVRGIPISSLHKLMCVAHSALLL